MAILVDSIVGIGIILLVIQIYTWYKVHSSLRLPQIPHAKTPKNYGLVYETKMFETEDGIKLTGWYIPVKNTKPIVIIVHGNRDSKGAVIQHSKYLHDAGYSTFIIDLRTDVSGSQVTLGIAEHKDVAAAYDYMKSLPENKERRVGFFGGSLGASASLIAAGKTGKGDFVIASVPYANYHSLIKQRVKLEKLPMILYPFAILAFAIELGPHYNSYAPDKYITSIKKPLFLISSARDNRVDGHDAELLYQKAREPKQFWKADAGHDVYHDLPAEYERRVLAFMKAVV